MNAKEILNSWLEEDDYEVLGQAVVNAYLACENFMSKNVVFSDFAVGQEHRSHLLRIFVEYEVNNLPTIRPGFFQELKPNYANNCWHIRLSKNGLILTTHFMGKNNFRNMARPAKNRALLADRNGDLFSNESQDIDISHEDGFAYCHLLHGGFKKPELSMLAIPTRDQRGIGASCHLPKPKPELVRSEEITDELVMRLRTQANEINKQASPE